MQPIFAAVVLGASGSVGNAVVAQLVQRGVAQPIVTLVRQSQSDQLALAKRHGIDLREVVLADMSPKSLEQASAAAAKDLGGEVRAFSALGVGAGTAKLSLDAHRATDVELNRAFARGVRAAGNVPHLAFLSAVGANPNASTRGSGAAGLARYSRVKAEAEEAVQRDGPSVVSIFRPAMILGSRHTPSMLAKIAPIVSLLTPSKYRSISTTQIANAMVTASVRVPAESRVYHFAEMQTLQS